MSSNLPTPFGDYLVFVDESGDHGLTAVNRDFPLFALAFCVFPKEAYVDEVTPAVRRLMLAAFGHDLVVLHEHDIRKKAGAFAMMSREPREQFLDALSRVIGAAPFTLLAVVIDKRELRLDGAESANPYHLALQFGLERVFRLLAECGQVSSCQQVFRVRVFRVFRGSNGFPEFLQRHPNRPGQKYPIPRTDRLSRCSSRNQQQQAETAENHFGHPVLP